MLAIYIEFGNEEKYLGVILDKCLTQKSRIYQAFKKYHAAKEKKIAWLS